MKMLAVFAVIILIGAVIFYFFSDNSLSNEYYKAHSQIKNTKDIFFVWLIIGNITAILIAAFMMVFPSHKIAGPVFHLEKDLEKIKSGKFPKKISVRKSDSLYGFAGKIDESLNPVKGKIKLAQNDINEMINYLNSLESADSISQKEIIEIRKKAEHVKSELEFFQITN